MKCVSAPQRSTQRVLSANRVGLGEAEFVAGEREFREDQQLHTLPRSECGEPQMVGDVAASSPGADVCAVAMAKLIILCI